MCFQAVPVCSIDFNGAVIYFRLCFESAHICLQNARFKGTATDRVLLQFECVRIQRSGYVVYGQGLCPVLMAIHSEDDSFNDVKF